MSTLTPSGQTPLLGPRPLRAPRGSQRSCKGWVQEAALRMLLNNLDPEVAEDPDRLVVYGGNGRAARSWHDLDTILATLRKLGNDETLLVQSGKPVGVFRTHDRAPRVLIANSLLVPRWATWEEFRRLEEMGLTMYGQMTAGSWIYIGTQGILQGTYETFAECGRRHFGGQGDEPSLRGKLVVSGGLGGMGGAQPLAATMNGGVFLGADVDVRRLEPPAGRWLSRLCRSGHRSRNSGRHRSTRAKRGSFHRCRLQHRGAVTNPRGPGSRPRCPHRSDVCARLAQRICPRRYLLSGSPSFTDHVPRGIYRARPRDRRPARSLAAAIEAARSDHVRLRQQSACSRARRGCRERLRHSGVHSRVHPSAILPGKRAVPLGGTFWRSGGHSANRRGRPRGVSRRPIAGAAG